MTLPIFLLRHVFMGGCGWHLLGSSLLRGGLAYYVWVCRLGSGNMVCLMKKNQEMDIVLHFTKLKLPKCSSLFSAIILIRCHLQKTLSHIRFAISSSVYAENVYYNHNYLFLYAAFQKFLLSDVVMGGCDGRLFGSSLFRVGAAYYLRAFCLGSGNMGGLMKKKLRYRYCITFL